ncbi:MAG: alpha/beta hydrolase [Chloroflexi bacterium]|nr:MAG: alpha/beta hydrolase [Chloroflexota bacterium]
MDRRVRADARRSESPVRARATAWQHAGGDRRHPAAARGRRDRGGHRAGGDAPAARPAVLPPQLRRRLRDGRDRRRDVRGRRRVRRASRRAPAGGVPREPRHASLHRQPPQGRRRRYDGEAGGEEHPEAAAPRQHVPLLELRALGDGYRRHLGRRGVAPPPLTLHEFRARPADRTVQGAGVRLHLLDWDGDARPDALFLHGGGLTAHTWDVVCDELRDRVRPLALDLRGHGDSEWSPDGHYPLGAHVADLESAMADLALKDFVLVGMSLGGLVALAYAGRHPRTLAALILVESGPEMRRSERLRDFMAADAEADSFDEFVDRAAAFNPLRDREHLRRSLRYALRRTPDGKWTWKYDRRILERGTEDVLPRARALWDAARSVDCPALVIRGGKSDIFLDEDAAELARVLRGEWVRIEGAGHTVQGDRPYDTANALRAFLDGHTIRPSAERGR